MTTAPTLQNWTTDLATALGLSPEVPIKGLLEVARDAAHGVERPAAPITTFLVGLAVGRGMSFEQACGVVSATLPAAPPEPPPIACPPIA